MASNTLQKQVQDLIKPWAGTTKQSPFTVDEVVVMMLVSRGPLTKQQIMDRILEKFGYYRAVSRTFFSSHVVCGIAGCSSGSAHDFTYSFRLAFQKLELPIILSSKDKPWEQSAAWTVKMDEARLFLQSRLHPAGVKTGTFRLSDLPPELRNKIYRLVFDLPRSGITPARGWNSSGFFYTRSRDYARGITQKSFFDVAPDIQTRTESIQHYLAILSVSKAIYQEAMPLFYGTNTFVFASIDKMAKFLRSTPRPRKDHIERIAFQFAWSGWALHQQKHKRASACFKLLLKMGHLRHLDIDVTAPAMREWEGMTGPSFSQVPGFDTLRQLRGMKTIKFYGAPGDIETVLAPLVLQPKPPPKASRKRKAKTEEGGSSHSTIRPKRRREPGRRKAGAAAG